jgi:hypothetical protein
MHGDEDDGDSQQEVGGQLMAEEHEGHEGGEDGGDGGRILLEDGVRKLVEEGGQDALRNQQTTSQHRVLRLT